MPISFSSLSGGGGDDGLDLVASFAYDTTGNKIEQSFDAGNYQIALYSEAGTVASIFQENSSGEGSLLESFNIPESGIVNGVVTLGAGIVKILVKGSTAPGTFIMKKAPFATPGSVAVVPDYATWNMTYMNTPGFVTNMWSDGDTILALPQGTTSSVYRSTDRGLTWSTVTLPGTATQKFGIVKSSNYWVITAYDNSTFRWWWSSDGVSWTQGTYGNSQGYINVSGLAVNGNTVVAISQQYGLFKGWRSTDGGANWSEFNLPNNGDNYSSCSYANGYWFAPGYNGPNVAYSTNGISWSNVTTNVPGQGGTVAYLDGTYYLPGGGSPGLGGSNAGSVYVSTDVTTWTTRSLPIVARWGACHTFDNTLIMTQHSTGGDYPGAILTSLDGVTWTYRTGPNVVIGKFTKQSGGPLLAAAWQSANSGDIYERYVLNSGFEYEVS